jgi:uncharacterized protein DUF6745
MSDKVEQLTPEQEKQCEEIAKEWLAIGLDTNPALRERAESGIMVAYDKAGLARPKEIRWVGSPPAAAKLAAELVGGTPASHLSGFVYGQHAAGWLSFYDAMNRVLGVDINELEGLMEVAKSAGWWLPFDELVIVCERPSILALDERDRLHSATGPAIAFPDGYKHYCFHGVTVPEHVIERPETITWQEIDAERNAEVRRVMMERYGTERYVKDSGAKVLSTDDYGELYRKDVPDDEPVVMVRVINSTPEGVRPGQWYWSDKNGTRIEDDSTLRMIAKTIVETGKKPKGFTWNCASKPEPEYKEYWLRVPPTMTTPRQAIAWTFGIDKPADYAPEKQS